MAMQRQTITPPSFDIFTDPESGATARVENGVVTLQLESSTHGLIGMSVPLDVTALAAALLSELAVDSGANTTEGVPSA